MKLTVLCGVIENAFSHIYTHIYISLFTMFILFLCDILYVCIFFLGKDLESDSGVKFVNFYGQGVSTLKIDILIF